MTPNPVDPLRLSELLCMAVATVQKDPMTATLGDLGQLLAYAGAAADMLVDLTPPAVPKVDGVTSLREVIVLLRTYARVSAELTSEERAKFLAAADRLQSLSGAEKDPRPATALRQLLKLRQQPEHYALTDGDRDTIAEAETVIEALLARVFQAEKPWPVWPSDLRQVATDELVRRNVVSPSAKDVDDLIINEALGLARWLSATGRARYIGHLLPTIRDELAASKLAAINLPDLLTWMRSVSSTLLVAISEGGVDDGFSMKDASDLLFEAARRLEAVKTPAEERWDAGKALLAPTAAEADVVYDKGAEVIRTTTPGLRLNIKPWPTVAPLTPAEIVDLRQLLARNVKLGPNDTAPDPEALMAWSEQNLAAHHEADAGEIPRVPVATEGFVRPSPLHDRYQEWVGDERAMVLTYHVDPISIARLPARVYADIEDVGGMFRQVEMAQTSDPAKWASPLTLIRRGDRVRYRVVTA